MSYVRIGEFAQRMEGGDAGQWFAREAGTGFVRIERAGMGLVCDDNVDRRALVTWTGCCTRVFGEQRANTLTYLLKYPVPPDYMDEFDAWFYKEHMAILLEEPTWHGCEFFRALRPSMYTFAAIHHLEPAAMKSSVRERSMATPWWNRLKKHDWFDKGFVRVMLKPLNP